MLLQVGVHPAVEGGIGLRLEGNMPVCLLEEEGCLAENPVFQQHGVENSLWGNIQMRVNPILIRGSFNLRGLVLFLHICHHIHGH